MYDVHVCMYNHIKLGGLGACSPRKFRFSEIASEAILGQKQSHGSYVVSKPVFLAI